MLNLLRKRTRPSQALDLGIQRQREIIASVAKSLCPRCKAPLRLMAYENSFSLSHFEAAIVCDTCKSRFVFNEKGLRGEYVEPAKTNV